MVAAADGPHPWPAPPKSVLAASPTGISGLQILHLLGEGGMGEVYQAWDQAAQRLVAVKFLAAGAGAANRSLQREASLMAGLRHPYLVAIHGAGTSFGRPYLIMDYVHGPSLRQLMTPGKAWPVPLAAPVLDKVALALSFMHAQGVLHLDLKPENVLLERRQDGAAPAKGESALTGFSSDSWEMFPDRLDPKLTDFGLAHTEREGQIVALTQGTADYSAPELRHGLPVDARADLFALATLTYELLTGRLPGRVYVPASRRHPLAPAAVDDLLGQALARDRDERLADVETFRRRLRHALFPGAGGRDGADQEAAE